MVLIVTHLWTIETQPIEMLAKTKCYTRLGSQRQYVENVNRYGWDAFVDRLIKYDMVFFFAKMHNA